jgi:hypothetical protein
MPALEKKFSKGIGMAITEHEHAVSCNIPTQIWRLMQRPVRVSLCLVILGLFNSGQVDDRGPPTADPNLNIATNHIPLVALLVAVEQSHISQEEIVDVRKIPDRGQHYALIGLIEVVRVHFSECWCSNIP